MRGGERGGGSVCRQRVPVGEREGGGGFAFHRAHAVQGDADAEARGHNEGHRGARRQFQRIHRRGVDLLLRARAPRISRRDGRHSRRHVFQRLSRRRGIRTREEGRHGGNKDVLRRAGRRRDGKSPEERLSRMSAWKAGCGKRLVARADDARFNARLHATPLPRRQHDIGRGRGV